MSSTFALWMIMILLFVVMATFILRRHRSAPEPMVPMHENNNHSLNLPFPEPPATLTDS
jgi:cytochrome c-type biogenesis protein CcmH/NrfF